MRSVDLGTINNLEQQFDNGFHLELFRRANYARQFEMAVKSAADENLISIPIYLSVGSEFTSAALSLVAPGINIFAQHRCHALYLSFGGQPEKLRDELLGLPQGLCEGRSGSNAIHSPDINLFGHSGLMGEQVPIAVGAAYASGKSTLTICGDASVEEDYIYPAMGWAASQSLPILFICEDNNLSILTEVAVRRTWNPCELARSFGMPALDITDDPWLIAHHARHFIQSRRPAFINIRTVRVLWHAGTGSDGEPEWDRYQLVINKLIDMGLGEKIRAIEIKNKEQVDKLWQHVKLNQKNQEPLQV